MPILEQTGTTGYDKPQYQISELNAKQLQILKEGVEFMKMKIVNSENTERLSFLEDCNALLVSLSQK